MMNTEAMKTRIRFPPPNSPPPSHSINHPLFLLLALALLLQHLLDDLLLLDQEGPDNAVPSSMDIRN